MMKQTGILHSHETLVIENMKILQRSPVVSLLHSLDSVSTAPPLLYCQWPTAVVFHRLRHSENPLALTHTHTQTQMHAHRVVLLGEGGDAKPLFLIYPPLYHKNVVLVSLNLNTFTFPFEECFHINPGY